MTFNLCKNTLGKCDLGVVGYVSHHGWLGNTSLAETAMGRYKRLNSPMLSLRDYNGQVAEALAGVKAMNKVIRLDMPVRQQVA